MIPCQSLFCDTDEKLAVLKPGVSYYCRHCGYVATHTKAQLVAASLKFKASVEPLAAPEPVVEAKPAYAIPASKSVDVPRGTKKSKKKGGKK